MIFPTSFNFFLTLVRVKECLLPKESRMYNTLIPLPMVGTRNMCAIIQSNIKVFMLFHMAKNLTPFIEMSTLHLHAMFAIRTVILVCTCNWLINKLRNSHMGFLLRMYSNCLNISCRGSADNDLTFSFKLVWLELNLSTW